MSCRQRLDIKARASMLILAAGGGSRYFRFLHELLEACVHVCYNKTQLDAPGFDEMNQTTDIIIRKDERRCCNT